MREEASFLRRDVSAMEVKWKRSLSLSPPVIARLPLFLQCLLHVLFFHILFLHTVLFLCLPTLPSNPFSSTSFLISSFSCSSFFCSFPYSSAFFISLSHFLSDSNFYSPSSFLHLLSSLFSHFPPSHVIVLILLLIIPFLFLHFFPLSCFPSSSSSFFNVMIPIIVHLGFSRNTAWTYQHLHCASCVELLWVSSESISVH